MTIRRGVVLKPGVSRRAQKLQKYRVQNAKYWHNRSLPEQANLSRRNIKIVGVTENKALPTGHKICRMNAITEGFKAGHRNKLSFSETVNEINTALIELLGSPMSKADWNMLPEDFRYQLQRWQAWDTRVSGAHPRPTLDTTPRQDPETSQADWQAGYDAGVDGKSYACPEGRDRVAWQSGYLEGKGHLRRKGPPSPWIERHRP